MNPLLHDEPLIFEQGQKGRLGVDWPDVDVDLGHLDALKREEIHLPDLSESQVVRHYTRLSRKKS